MKICVIAQSGGGLPAFLRAVPRISVTEKLQVASFRRMHRGLSPFSPTLARTKNRGLRRRQQTEEGMRDGFDYEIPDTTACKEWLGIVGSMVAAVAICAFLFGGSIFT
jgi:hypothetical protein